MKKMTIELSAIFAILIAWLLSVLDPQRIAPIPTFSQEAYVALTVILAGIFFTTQRKNFTNKIIIPTAGIILISLGALAIFSIRRSQVAYSDMIIWPVGSLICGALAAWIARVYANQNLSKFLVIAWLWAFAIGAVGTAAAMWAQIFLPGEMAVWLFPRQPLQAPFGNLAQRNQAALVLGFGLLSLAYLGRHQAKPLQLKRGLSMVFGLLLLSGIALSQSRIAFGFLFVAGIAWGMLWAPAHRRLLGGLLGLLALFSVYFAMQWFIYTGFGLGQLFPPGSQRMADRGLGQRLGMLHVAWAEFSTHPLLGGGFGSFSDWEYRLGLKQKAPLYSTNAHNLFAQLAAETGLAGLAVVVIPAGISAWNITHRLWCQGLEHWEGWVIPALGLCLMILGYSMTEYPLWYVFFLVPFMMFWGLLDDSGLSYKPSRSVRALIIVLLFGMATYLGMAMQRYWLLAKVTQATFQPGSVNISKQQLQNDFSKVNRFPGFSIYSDLLVFMSLSVDHFALPDKTALGERVVARFTGAATLEKLAALYALNGQRHHAATTLGKVCAYNPNDCSDAGDRLRHLEQIDPTAFGPVAKLFFAMPQSKIQGHDINVLRPWDKQSTGTVVTIDPSKTLFGFDLALYASGLAQQGVRSGSFIASPAANGHVASTK